MKRKIFVGIDVHNKQWSVAIVEDQQVVKESQIAPQAKGLLKWLQREFPEQEITAVYEAGYHGFTIARELKQEGVKTLVVHPSDVLSNDKQRRRKTDRIDARKLARHLSAGLLQGIYIPTVEEESDRGLFRLRVQMSKDTRRQQQRIKGLLSYNGVKVPAEYTRWSKKFIAWLRSGVMPHEIAEKTLQYQVDLYEHVRDQKKEVERELSALANALRHVAELSAMQKIIGVGILTAIGMKLEVMNMGRFRNLEHLSSYLGICPTVHSSGAHHHEGGLSPRGNRRLRTLLVQCTWKAIQYDPVMKEYYQKYKRGRKSGKALIATLRKLVRRMRRAMLDPESFHRSGVIPVQATAS